MPNLDAGISADRGREERGTRQAGPSRSRRCTIVVTESDHCVDPQSRVQKTTSKIGGYTDEYSKHCQMRTAADRATGVRKNCACPAWHCGTARSGKGPRRRVCWPLVHGLACAVVPGQREPFDEADYFNQEHAEYGKNGDCGK